MTLLPDDPKKTDVQVRELAQRVRELEADLEDKDRALKARFDELAAMTELLEEQRRELSSLKSTPVICRPFMALRSFPRFPVTPWYVRFSRGLRRRVPQRAVNRIAQSSYFDAQWYLAQYPELAANKLARKNPALHYLKVGGFQGFDPGPGFDSQWYLEQYPDVKAIAINPLVHYLLHGADEGRRIRPHQVL